MHCAKRVLSIEVFQKRASMPSTLPSSESRRSSKPQWIILVCRLLQIFFLLTFTSNYANAVTISSSSNSVLGIVKPIEKTPEKQTPEEIFNSNKAAAEKGDKTAQFNLGILYYNGDGAPQNYSEAFNWFKKSAEQGDHEAQFNCGIMSDRGQGTPKNSMEAFKWYKRAAEQGYGKALYSLGMMYQYGVEGIPKHLPTAYAYFSLGAAAGNAEATTARDTMKSQLTPAELAEADKLSQSLFNNIQMVKAGITPPPPPPEQEKPVTPEMMDPMSFKESN